MLVQLVTMLLQVQMHAPQLQEVICVIQVPVPVTLLILVFLQHVQMASLVTWDKILALIVLLASCVQLAQETKVHGLILALVVVIVSMESRPSALLVLIIL